MSRLIDADASAAALGKPTAKNMEPFAKELRSLLAADLDAATLELLRQPFNQNQSDYNKVGQSELPCIYNLILY